MRAACREQEEAAEEATEQSLIPFPTHPALRHQRAGSTHAHSSGEPALSGNAIVLSAAAPPLISALSC